jgi:sugar lactone lactonase YvrE
MIKLSYILTLIVISSFVSCEKKSVAPISASNANKTTVDTVSGKIYTIAGNGTEAYSGDGGLATAAELGQPAGVAIDSLGNIYIADQQNQRIRKVTTNGIISTIAGNGTEGYSGDGGPAVSAEMHYPYGIAVDAWGNIYFSDPGNNCVRKINTAGIILTVAGVQSTGWGGYSGDGGPATSATLSTPMGLAIDGSGNLYIADWGNGRIRKVSTTGIISTIAGNGVAIPISGNAGDGGLATVAEIDAPQGVAVDASGNVYIADYNGNTVRKVNTNGIISTIAGVVGNPNINGGYNGDGILATTAELYNPTDVAVDNTGNVYISDANNSRIRLVNVNGIISSFAGNGAITFSGDGGLAVNASIGFSQGIALDNKGNLYFSELYLNRVRVIYK